MSKFCVNNHTNRDDVQYCQACGSNTFRSSGPVISVAPPYNGLAIASVAVLLAYIPILTPIAQIVLGLKAREQIRTTNEQGDGLAIAGIVVGIAGLVLTVIAIVLILAIVTFAATHANTGVNTNTGTYSP